MIIVDAPFFDEMDAIQSLSYLNPLLPNTTNLILVRERSLAEDEEVVIEGYPNLKSIQIMSGCYHKATKLKVVNCQQIHSIYIADDCFLGDGGSITIADCPHLQNISIGKSFIHFQNVRLESGVFIDCISADLPSLSSISFGCWSLGSDFPQSSHSECLSDLLWAFCDSSIPLGMCKELLLIIDVANQFSYLFSLFKDSLCMILNHSCIC